MDLPNPVDGADFASAGNPSPQTITALIITRNEGANIGRCLRSVAWADARIVVDSGSIDATVDIASRLGAVVVHHNWEGYSLQRNFGASLVRSGWILVVDADERVSPALRDEIKAFVGRAPASMVAARIPRRDWMFGRFVAYGSWRNERHIRLYRQGKAVWIGEVHESLTIDGGVGELNAPLLHFSHLTIEKFIAKLNSYTDIEARTMKAAGQSVGLGRAALGALRAFLGQYVRLQGFRDGGHGFILAVYMALYHFTTRAKLWALNNANTPPPDPEDA